jgi:hypothetical protein
MLALVGLASVQARAGSLTLVVTAADGVSDTITGPPLGSSSNGGNTLTVTNISSLNLFLSSNGSAVQFNSLSASSDFAPGGGVASGSFVTQAGSVYYDTALTGTGKVTVEAFQNGFVLPSGPSGSMQSSASGTYTSATAGSTETFTSAYNTTLTALPLTSLSSGTIQNGYNQGNMTSIPMFVTPFELSNTSVFNMVANASSQSTDGFAGSTTVTAASVPEPTSMALFLTGNIALAILGVLRRRRRAGVA